MLKYDLVITDLGISSKVLHEHGGHLGQVGGAARAGHMLIARAAQHGVHGVAHFMEQVVHRTWGQQGWASPTPAAQGEHHHYNRVLETQVINN